MMSLFISLLYDALNEYTYNAELAGILYKITGTVYSMDVRTQLQWNLSIPDTLGTA